MVSTDRTRTGLRRRLFVLAWPAILEMVLHMMVGVVDTAMVGRLGPQELAAVGLGSRILFSALFVFAAIGTGAAALVARAVGSGDRAEAGRIAAQAVVLGFLIGGMLALAGLTLAGTIFNWLGMEPRVARLGEGYLRIAILPAFLTLPLFIANAVLRGAGNTRTPLLVAFLANGINIGVDYLLIFGHLGLPAMGVLGAATGTALAQTVGCLLVMTLIFQGRTPLRLRPAALLNWDGGIVRRMLRLSLPAGMEEMTFTLGEMIFTLMVAYLGTTAFAAHQVAVAVESLSFMPGYGFAIATATTVGQSLGGEKPGEAREGGRQGALLALGIMGTAALLFILFPRQLVALFAPGQEEVIALGAICVRISALAQPAIAVEMILAGALRGAGDTRHPLLVTSVGYWLLRIPLTLLVVFVWGLPVWSVWLVMVADWFFRGGMIYYYFQQGKWLRVRA